MDKRLRGWMKEEGLGWVGAQFPPRDRYVGHRNGKGGGGGV